MTDSSSSFQSSSENTNTIRNSSNNENDTSLDASEETATTKLKAITTETTLLSEISTTNNYNETDNENAPYNSITISNTTTNSNNAAANAECGCCLVKFKNHQHLANIKLFTFFMCLTVMLTNALTVGYRNSVVTTIEKFFELSSIMSGTLSGSLEIGSLIATLLVSYFFANRNIPKCIAVSSLLCSVGSFIYAIPHFITNYKINIGDTMNSQNKTSMFSNLICQLSGSGGNSGGDSLLDLVRNHQKEPCFEKSTNFLLFFILVIANVLIGSSSAPLYTLGTAYIDNHVSANNSSIYLGFVYAMLALGPVVGYLLGAALLSVYVNFLSMTQYEQHFKLTPNNSAWIGAWWTGFVLLGVLLFVTSFPFFCFPSAMKKKCKKVDEVEVKCALNNSNAGGNENFGDLKTLPQAIKNIVINRVFIITTFAFCCEITIISGFMTFLPKYIEHQFSLNNSVANIYTGAVAIPGAVIGIVLGGFLVKRFQINPIGAAKMAIISNIFCAIGICVLIFVGCSNIKMAGTTISYGFNELSTKNDSTQFNLTSTCNLGCNCSPNLIEPICGTNGVTYFSPCYAGCTKHETVVANDTNNNSEKFQSCTCIAPTSAQVNHDQNDVIVTPMAKNGFCPSNCKALVPFLIILFFITLFTSINQMPMIMVTLRSVTDIERPFALGVQLVIMRLLAYIPSPLIFGKAIDSTCLVWRRDECEQSGSCLFYDREKFRYIYGSIAALYKILSTLLFLLLFIIVRKYKFKQKPIEKLDGYLTRSVASLNTPN